MKKILVTGSEGLIGKKITKYLKKKNIVLGIDKKNNIDLNDESQVEKFFKKNNNFNYLINLHGANEHVVYKKNKLNKKTVANSYSIQISSWNEFEDAEKNMHKLNKLGYKSYIDTKEQNKNTLYRVRIGKKLTYNEAKKIRNQLKKHDIKDVWIDKN